jgi:hypothetical protein
MASFPNPQPPRPWQEVAQELAKEYNRTRIQELANELNLPLAQLEAAPTVKT